MEVTLQIEVFPSNLKRCVDFDSELSGSMSLDDERTLHPTSATARRAGRTPASCRRCALPAFADELESVLGSSPTGTAVERLDLLVNSPGERFVTRLPLQPRFHLRDSRR